MTSFEFTLNTKDGIHLYSQAWQPDLKPRAVICLVHGLGEHSSRYTHVAQAFTDAGFALVAMDLRGHGKSPGKRGHVAAYDLLLDDIDLMLTEARLRYPGIPLFLYGHSMGGNLALYYVMRKKPEINGIIDSSGYLRPGTKIPALRLLLGKIMDKVLPDFLMNNGLEPTAMSHDPEVINAYKNDPLVHDRLSPRLGLGILQAGEWILTHAAEFPPIPLLVMHGDKDRIASFEASQQFVAQIHRDVVFKPWEGLYHETHNEYEKQSVIDFMIGWVNVHLPKKQ